MNSAQLLDKQNVLQTLYKQYAEFELLYNTAPIGLALIDRDLRYVRINEHLAEINGRTVEEHIGRSIRDLVPDIADQIEPLFYQILDTGEPVLDLDVVGSTHADLDNVKHWMSSYYPLKIANGSVLGITIVVYDITEFKRATNQLDKQIQFEKLLSNFSSTFIALPLNEIDKEINKWLRIFGEFLGVDRCFIDQFSEDKNQFRTTHMWSTNGIEPDDEIFEVTLTEFVPWYTDKMISGEPLIFGDPDEIPEEAANERQYCSKIGIKSSAIIPMVIDKSVIGSFGVDSIRETRIWTEEFVQRFHLVAEVFSKALKRKHSEEELQKTMTKISHLKDRLQAENLYLREEIKLDHNHVNLASNSLAIKTVLSQVELVAETDSTVLILGETGTGKELIAYAIHNLSPRRNHAMVKVNCASLPSSLIEAELFGREKGAYTGALTKQIGRFEIANGSTIFLDEIGELSPELQVKLLRVLQDGTFERLGSPKTITVNIRVIAATNRDLDKAVEEGKFREDLFYRLNVFPIIVPPLRERIEDIPLLVWTFVEEFEQKMGKRIDKIPNKVMEDLKHNYWPGNVRELRNILERAMILNKDSTLNVQIQPSYVSKESETMTLESVEKIHLLRILDMTDWRIRGADGAAELLGLIPTTLESKMKKLGISRRT